MRKRLPYAELCDLTALLDLRRRVGHGTGPLGVGCHGRIVAHLHSAVMPSPLSHELGSRLQEDHAVVGLLGSRRVSLLREKTLVGDAVLSGRDL